jgi:tryptophan synthase beta chain
MNIFEGLSELTISLFCYLKNTGKQINKSTNQQINNKMINQADKNGYYGAFGGAYIPEILHGTVEKLKEAYFAIKNDASFKAEYYQLLKNYVGRPSPLYFANRLSEKYGTQIYLKREDLNHTGAHKINNSLGQILLAKRMGKTRIIAETGAGQHGVATATACALMGLECIVFMGKTDVERQFLNVQKMKMLGAVVEPVTSGNMTLKDATNEAIRYWCSNPDSFYIIGSTVGPHPYPDMVAFFQSVISEEIKEQLTEQTGRDYPDYLIACIGGGSNAMGTYYHYLDNEKVKIISAEAGGLGVDSGETAATIHVGTLGIIHGFKTLLMQNEDGQITEPYSISAGLDYPGIGPAHAHFARSGRTKVYAITDDEALDAAFELTRLEGIIPAIESAHAMAILKKEKFGKDDVVVITVSGRGDKDMDTYVKYFKD